MFLRPPSSPPPVPPARPPALPTTTRGSCTLPSWGRCWDSLSPCTPRNSSSRCARSARPAHEAAPQRLAFCEPRTEGQFVGQAALPLEPFPPLTRGAPAAHACPGVRRRGACSSREGCKGGQEEQVMSGARATRKGEMHSPMAACSFVICAYNECRVALLSPDRSPHCGFPCP